MPAVPSLPRRPAHHPKLRRRQKQSTRIDGREISPALELSAFGSFSGVSPGDTLNAVTLTVSQFASTALMGPPTYELWDDSGTPALLGSGAGTTSTSSANVDSLTFTNVTYAMLATLRVRVYAHQGSALPGAIQNVNWVNLTANITPVANTSLLAGAAGSAKNIQAAIGVTAVLASGTGTAQNATAQAPSGTTVTAILATAAAAAQGNDPGIGVTAVLASGAAAALNANPPTPAVLASGAATAQGNDPGIGVTAVLASAAATALNANPPTPAILASAAATAQGNDPGIGVTAVLASGTGAALNANPPTPAVLASGAGAALGATASTVTSGSATAVLATAAATALNANPPTPAILASAAATAQGNDPGIGVTAVLASGAAAALNANPPVPVVLASGAGAALGATASTTSAGTGAAVLASAAGTARSPAAAIGVIAGRATGTGTAAPVTGPVIAYRIFPSASGPSAPVSYAGNFLCGVIFKVTDGAQWFGGYYKWVAPGGDIVARKFCLWQVTAAGAGVLLTAATVTSGTLTAGQWNFIPLATPVKLAIGTAYNACTGWTAVNGFEDSDTAGAGTGATDSFGTGGHTAGIVTGPLTAFSDHAFSRPEPYGMAQGVFSVAGTDPAVTMPFTGSNSANFWMDVQVSPAGPAGYPGPYRLWPGKADTNSLTTTDAPVNYDVATEFAISQPCLLGKIWYFSPPGTAQLATAANVWSITGSGLTGTLAAGTTSPSWSGAAASGWVSCTFTGVVLPPGTYKVSVYNSAATPDAWGAKDALTDYWRAGEGAGGITWGPLSAPNLAAASLAYNYDGSMGGHVPPFTDGTTLAGQPTFAQGPPDSYPYLYAPVTSPTSGSTQNYWVDVEVTPVIPAGLASGTGTAQSPAAAVGVSAGLASAAGAALNANPPVPAVLATATATAQGNDPGIGVTAVLASGAAAARNANPPVPAVLASGAAAALNPSAQTVTSGSATAVLASGAATALSSAFPDTSLASGAAAALNATVSTLSFTNAQAGLASGAGVALNANPPTPIVLATAAATAQGNGPGIGARAVLASGTGAAGNPGRAASAGLATGSGTAQNLVFLARAQAATALAHALNATAAGAAVVKKATAVSAVATQGSVTSGVTAGASAVSSVRLSASGLTLAAAPGTSDSLAGQGTSGSATALLSVRRDHLAAAPDTDPSLNAAATTGEGGP